MDPNMMSGFGRFLAGCAILLLILGSAVGFLVAKVLT